MRKNRYNKKPDGIFTHRVENQTIKVNIFFNQNTSETFDNTLMQSFMLENDILKR